MNNKTLRLLFVLSFTLVAAGAVLAQAPPMPGAAHGGKKVIDLRQTVLPEVGKPSAPMDYRSDLFNSRYKSLLPEEQVGITIYENRNRSVVNIDTVMVRQGRFFQPQTAEGLGSGVVLSKDGVILTNSHVVNGANDIKVRLFDGGEYPAINIGEDPSTDIALLKIDAPADALFPVEFADSSQLLVGQAVFAIGNPFGYERTMTRGIISSLNRTIESPNNREIKGVIQIDAAINVGNSGGALFDSSGRLIGMNTAIASRIGENTGVGFAIPVNTIARISHLLLNEGKVVRGDAGVLQMSETPHGLVPVMIEDGGPVDLAGIRGGKTVEMTVQQYGQTLRGYRRVVPKEGMDLIVGINDQPIRTVQEFLSAVESHRPGDKITMNIIRQGQAMNVVVELK
ncbi:MAG: trypsin-like peptidase domain-containing protein [Thermoguttaceae bacterium]|nr:trypsin-like peptidase domain-containing protein [Thermoguttaceae bacterium]